MSRAMDELEARAGNALNRLRDLTDQMKAVRVRKVSPDGVVTVEVDGNGAMLDLELSARTAQLSPKEFERILVSTAAEAARCAFAERAELATAFNRGNSE
ncbi:YbaB/EbfC family nucleoid-associated protein [Nocardia grenadensis]